MSSNRVSYYVSDDGDSSYYENEAAPTEPSPVAKATFKSEEKEKQRQNIVARICCKQKNHSSCNLFWPPINSHYLNLPCIGFCFLTAIIVALVFFFLGYSLASQPENKINSQFYQGQNVCPGADWKYIPEQAACYLLSMDKLTHKQAEAACNEYGHDVHLLTDYIGKDEVFQVQNMLPESFLDKFLGVEQSVTIIGLRSSLSSDLFTCPVFGGKANLWNDHRSNCSEPTEYICRKLVCPFLGEDSPRAVYHEGACYWHNMDALNWIDARGLCRELRGDLVSIHTAEEQALVESLALKGTYIGLNSRAGEGWQWEMIHTTDRPRPYVYKESYDNWVPGGNIQRESQRCVQLVASGEWSRVDCKAERSSVCKGRVKLY